MVLFTDHHPLKGAFKSPESMRHDPVALNQINEIAQFSSDIRFLAGKHNVCADWLSRPQEVPLGDAHKVPSAKDSISFETLPVAALEETVFNTLDPVKLAEAQTTCPMVANHKAGNHARTLNMQYVEYSLGIWLSCDTSMERSRPLVPADH